MIYPPSHIICLHLNTCSYCLLLLGLDHVTHIQFPCRNTGQASGPVRSRQTWPLGFRGAPLFSGSGEERLQAELCRAGCGSGFLSASPGLPGRLVGEPGSWGRVCPGVVFGEKTGSVCSGGWCRSWAPWGGPAGAGGK